MYLVSVATVLVACRGPDRAARPLDLTDADAVWHGGKPLDHAGRAIDVVDGGRDDLTILIGAPSTDNEGIDGVVELGEGHGGAYQVAADTPDGDLDEVAPVQYQPSESPRFGDTVARVGDADADGAADVAVFGYYQQVEPHRAVHVYRADSAGLVALEDAWARIAMTRGESEEAPHGVASCGDLDGDTVDDLCLASSIPIDGPEVSEARVFFGPLPAGDVPWGSADLSLRAAPEERAGFVLEGGSDLDGDGLPELLVSAEGRSEGDGGVYVVGDPGRGEVQLDTFPLWAGEPGDGSAGHGLAVGGDLDGDGLGDLFVGAHQFADRAGRGYVVVDKAGGSLGDAHLVIVADGGPDSTGASAAIGDLDGDGGADLAVGVPRDSFSGLDEPGRVAVFLGPLDPGQVEVRDADRIVVVGSASPDGFGFAVDAADVDADGVDDLVIGAPEDGRNGPGAGAVYLFTGPGLFP